MALGRWNAAAIDDAGNKMDGASVEVRRESDNVLVSVYSDRAGTISLGNPFTAADGGNIGFHVAGGAYKITATLGAFSRVWRYAAVGLNQESDVTAGDVVGPAISTDFGFPRFNGVDGKALRDDAILLDTDTALAANSDTKIPSQRAVKTYADSLVVGLIDDRGNYNASVNTFPASGGSGTAGAILKGDLWFISVAGTLGGVAVAIGDQVRALVDTPGQTAANWAVTEGNVGFVPAPIASPTFTGVPAGPTAAPGTNTTQLSTTAFVKAAVDVVLGGVASAFDTLSEIVAGFIPNSLLTTRGDIITRSATVPQRLALGAASLPLVSDGTDAVYGVLPITGGGTGQTTAPEAVGELIQALTIDTAPVPSTDILGGYDASADTGKGYTVEKIATLALPSRPALANRYYGGWGSNPGTATVTTLAINTLYAVPFYASSKETWTRISIDVTTLAALGNARLGIFDDAGTGRGPGALVLDAGVVATTSTGIKEITISQALEVGLYWLVIVVDVAVSIRATGNTGSHLLPTGAATPGAVDTAASKAFTYGVLSGSTPFGAVTYLSTYNPPLIMMRVV